MTESGASGRCGSGVTRAIPTAAPARWPAHGPTFASSRRRSRSRQTMNAQRCWFFELPARRPAWRIRSRCAGSSGRSANARIARRVGSRPRPGRVAVVGVAALRRRRGRGSGRGRGLVAPGSATWASVRKPPGLSSMAPKRLSASGIRSAGTAAAASPAASGVERPAEGASRGTRHRRAGSPGTRTATNAGRPRRGGSRSARRGCRPAGPPGRPARGGEPGQVRDRHDGVVASPWASRIGAAVAGDGRARR